jgi:copper chaperone
MTETLRYRVPGMHCDHCEAAVKRELEAVSGVEAVDVDLEGKLVIVRGENMVPTALVEAIDEAGYEAQAVAAR